MVDSSFGRLVGILFNPVKTLRSIADRPTVAVPIVTAILVGLAITAVMLPKVDQGELVRQQLEKTGTSISEAQIEQQVEMVEKFGDTITWVGAVVSPLLLYPFLALVFFLVFKILGSKASFRANLSVVLYGMLPVWGLASVLTIPVVLGQAELSLDQVQQGSLLMSNLGFLANEDTHPALAALLRNLDLFVFWALALLTVGFHEISKISKGKVAAVVVSSWLVLVSGLMGLATISSAFTS